MRIGLVKTVITIGTIIVAMAVVLAIAIGAGKE